MRLRKIALTGPHAAALLGLDGYRDQSWPVQWCAPANGTAVPGIIRTRRWSEPLVIADWPVAPPALVLRHLGATPHVDDITPVERVELAVEHALREGLVHLGDLRGRGRGQPGDVLLREVLRLRGDEPPTGSYAETRALQLLRRHGWERLWRQVEIVDHQRLVHVVDFVVPYRLGPRKQRPAVFLPHHGLLVEVDGRGPHEPQFERDHRRQTTYDRMGYDWLSFTPNQFTHALATVLMALDRRYHKGRASHALAA